MGRDPARQHAGGQDFADAVEGIRIPYPRGEQRESPHPKVHCNSSLPEISDRMPCLMGRRDGRIEVRDHI
jgi:hypothetical protein